MSITLPLLPAANGIQIALLDYSLTLRPATGGEVQKVTRAGSRFRATLTFPPMVGSDAKLFIARFIKAKRVGTLRVEFPLLENTQGSPGSPVVDGAGQAGTTLLVRGATASYVFQEGYWISIVDGTGQPYLHVVTDNATVSGTGTASLSIEPPLRYPFADGATILAAAPVIEGFIDGGEWTWDIDVAHHYGMSVIIEEAA